MQATFTLYNNILPENILSTICTLWDIVTLFVIQLIFNCQMRTDCWLPTLGASAMKASPALELITCRVRLPDFCSVWRNERKSLVSTVDEVAPTFGTVETVRVHWQVSYAHDLCIFFEGFVAKVTHWHFFCALVRNENGATQNQCYQCFIGSQKQWIWRRPTPNTCRRGAEAGEGVHLLLLAPDQRHLGVSRPLLTMNQSGTQNPESILCQQRL